MNERLTAPWSASTPFRLASRRLRLRMGLAMALILVGLTTASAGAAPTTMVDLGTASTYAVLSGTSVSNTASAPGAPHTTIRGDLGVKADAAPAGFPPGVVTGSIRKGAAVDPAHADLSAAYAEIATRPGGAPLAGALVGVTVLPGLHTITGAASNTGTVTLDAGGNANAVFVIQVNGALSFAAGSHVVLANKAQASRVFWQVNGAGAVGALADFAGTLIAKDAIGIGNGVIFNGRALARDGALTLDNNQFYGSPPVLTIDGGDAAQTTDTTPAISGTTDVEAPATVTVTVNGQTLTATPVEGVWTIESPILANGTYPVSASVQDGVGNLGSASQQLTVDTVLPLITLDSGATSTTSDPMPTIAGTSDVAPDTTVRVTIGPRNLRALVHEDGSWNVRSPELAEGPHTILASVSDLAGNQSSASQILTIDTGPTALSIIGGATALTNDPTPSVRGTAEVAPGTPVTVYVANETLAGVVDGSGGWSVTATRLADGPHRFVAVVDDAAGNRAKYTQLLTIDTVAPVVAVNGGPNATTASTAPTIAGTTDAAPGATVVVTVAGRSMTALVQGDHAWNTNAGTIGEGTWPVVASVRDPAGNTGVFKQTLRIAKAGPLVTSAVCPPQSLQLEGLARNKKRGTAVLSVTGGGAGRIDLRGSRSVKPFSVSVTASGEGELRVRARGVSARRLTKRGKVFVKVSVSYVPGGDCDRAEARSTLKLVKKR